MTKTKRLKRTVPGPGAAPEAHRAYLNTADYLAARGL